MSEDLSKRRGLIREKICELCAVTFYTRQAQVRFCGRHCATRAVAASRVRTPKPPAPVRPCEWCREPFSPPQPHNRFCGKSCSARWRCTFRPKPPEHIAKMVKASAAKGKSDAERKASSERMKRLNSDPAFRAKVDAAAKLRKGKSWIGQRGGNGFLTKSQIALCIALDWPLDWLEYAVLTSPVKDRFVSLPNCYKVDLAHPGLKVAVEVDGPSHNTPKWRFLDARKTAVLNCLGWKVLRFTNAEIEADLPSITSKLKSITTTSPMGS